jgi:hypothetical protein
VLLKDEGGLLSDICTDDAGVRWTGSWADGARFTASLLATRGGGGASEHAGEGFGR